VAALKELSQYKSDLVGVQEIRWQGSGTEPAGESERGRKTMNYVQVFVDKKIISAVKRVTFVSDRMSYIILIGRWCHIIALNVHAPTKDKTDDVKGSFYEELECV
jgi:hypothetical protein